MTYLMDGRRDARSANAIIGVAGRCSTDEEKSYVKQAVFLLRYRMRFLSQQGELPVPPLPDLD